MKPQDVFADPHASESSESSESFELNSGELSKLVDSLLAKQAQIHVHGSVNYNFNCNQPQAHSNQIVINLNDANDEQIARVMQYAQRFRQTDRDQPDASAKAGATDGVPDFQEEQEGEKEQDPEYEERVNQVLMLLRRFIDVNQEVKDLVYRFRSAPNSEAFIVLLGSLYVRFFTQLYDRDHLFTSKAFLCPFIDLVACNHKKGFTLNNLQKAVRSKLIKIPSNNPTKI